MATDKTFPSDDKIWMLLAESVRLESPGKISILGFFGGETIQLAHGTSLPAAFQLALVFMLRDGAGTFQTSISIKKPVTTESVVIKLPDSVKLPNESHGVVVLLQPFQVSELGTYEVTLALDNKLFSRKINIIMQPNPA